MNDLISYTTETEDNSFRKAGKGLVNAPEQIIMSSEEGELNLIDRKIWPYLLNRAHRELTYGNQTIHRIPVSDILKYLNLVSGSSTGSNLKRINDSLNRLASVDIVIDYVDENNVKTSGRAHYLSYTMTIVEDGWINYSFDPFLLKFLSHPKVFSTISLAHLRKFENNTAAKFYKIMALKVNMYYPYWQPSVEEFRKKLNLNDTYQRYDNLKRFMDGILEEVNSLAPFYVIMEEPQRSGKGGKITSLNFHAKPKGPQALIQIPVSGDKKKKSRDPNTIDLLDGLTDMERNKTQAGLTQQAIDLAIELLGPERFVDKYIEQWTLAMSGRRIRDCDNSFLSWLGLKLSSEKDDELSALDEDTFAMMIEKWEGSK